MYCITGPGEAGGACQADWGAGESLGEAGEAYQADWGAGECLGEAGEAGDGGKVGSASHTK